MVEMNGLTKRRYWWEMLKSKTIPKFENHERLFSKIKCEENGCWLFTGYISNRGYGTIGIGDITYQAHRVSWSIFNGELTQGLVLDHICHNRACVNPEHLREVKHKTNTLENSLSPAAANKIKTHCIRGHEFSTDNTIIKINGNRGCRACAKWHNEKRYKNG